MPAILPPGITIRLAAPGDAALLLDVMLRCWTGTVALDSSAYRETEADIVGQLGRGGGALVFSGDVFSGDVFSGDGFSGDAAIGGGRFHPVAGPTGDPREWVEIKRVGVLKSWRKHGLAIPLIAALEAEAVQRGHAGAQLGVRADQPRLIAFWLALGYALADDVQMHTVNPLTPPPITMRKRFG
ncbi:MAG: GNAT family N-acetyltransferase [Alphaproteobacteria bacterium]